MLLSKIHDWLKRYWSMRVITLMVLMAAGVAFQIIWQVGGRQAMALRAPLTIFEQRSPGARAEGPLLQTKSRLASTGRRRIGKTPSERVLTQVRFEPDVPSSETPGFGAPTEITENVFPFGEDQVLVDDVSRVAPLEFPPTLDSTGGGAFIGNPTTPIAAVPEPATWLSMIIGFAMIGAALRRVRPGTVGICAAVPNQ